MSKTIKVEAEIAAQFNLFATDSKEGYSGGGSYMIEEFTQESASLLEQALIRILKDNPNQLIKLVIKTEGIDYDTAVIPETK